MRGYDGTGSGGGDLFRPVDNVNEPDDLEEYAQCAVSEEVRALWTRIAKPIVDTLTLKVSQ